MAQIDLTPIFQAIIALLAALVTYKLIPWIKARTTETQQATLRALVRTFVFAAEQIYGAGNGKEKLAYVKGALENAGFTVNEDEIEAVVWEYLNSGVPLGNLLVEDGEAEDGYYDDGEEKTGFAADEDRIGDTEALTGGEG